MVKYNIYLIKYLVDCFPAYFSRFEINSLFQLTIHLENCENLHPVLFILKKNTLLNYELLVDICCVHYLNIEYELIYILLNIQNGHRIFIKIKTNHNFANISSVSNLYNSANWLEREVCDMFGLRFTGHKDLRRILTDYGFRGQPLRKDYPLCGFVEVRYDDSKKYLVYEPIELSQNFRNYDGLNPWL